MLRLGIIVAAGLTGGCQTMADSSQTLTVNYVADRLVALDGQTVRIRGWLERCRGIECVLRGSDHATLSIASGPFDTQLDAKTPAQVVLLATVDASCHSGKLICLDRTPDLRVVKIEKIYPATTRRHN